MPALGTGRETLCCAHPPFFFLVSLSFDLFATSVYIVCEKEKIKLEALKQCYVTIPLPSLPLHVPQPPSSVCMYGLCAKQDPAKAQNYAVVVCISGDGMLHEALNGLCVLDSAKKRVTTRSMSREEEKRGLLALPLSILPGGSRYELFPLVCKKVGSLISIIIFSFSVLLQWTKQILIIFIYNLPSPLPSPQPHTSSLFSFVTFPGLISLSLYLYLPQFSACFFSGI